MTTKPLDYYLQAWALSNPKSLAVTLTSHIHTVEHEGETVVLKLLTDVGEEEKVGAVALKHYAGHGAVKLLRHDDHAQLLEYIAGGDLVPMVRRGDDEQATRIVAGVLERLHSAPGAKNPTGLYPMRRWFQELFDKADSEAEPDSLYVRAARLAEKLLAEPQHERVVHGDIHHENIRHHASRGWVAIDPKGVYGERTYDLANTFCNPLNMPEVVENEARILKTAAIFEQCLGIEQERILAFLFVYACLSASWSLSDGDEESELATLKIARLVEPHLTSKYQS